MSHRYVSETFWTDPYVDGLDPSEKLLYIYLLTNPQCNIAGIYELPVKRISFETGFDRDMVDKLLTRLVNDAKILRQGDWILIVNYAKHQVYKNPSVQKGMQRIINELPVCVQTVTGFDRLSHFTLLNLTLPNGNMFNKYSDDYEEEAIQTDPDHKQKKAKMKQSVGDDVQAVFDLFSNPAKVTWRLREIERVAAQALFDAYGLETLQKRVQRIEAEKKINGDDPYFPLVTTPSQLLDKMEAVERYLKI